MKKSIVIISIITFLISAHLVQAQSSVLLSSTNMGTIITSEAAKSKLSNDLSAVSTIANHIKDNSSFFLDKFNYTNQTRIEVEINLSETGDITSYEIVNSKEKEITTPILNALSKLSKVEPIIINGQAKAQRLLIPIVLKK